MLGSGIRESGFEIHVYVSDDRHDGDEYEGGYKPLDYCFHVFVFVRFKVPTAPCRTHGAGVQGSGLPVKCLKPEF